MKTKQHWLVYAIITTIFWGVWGALIEIPQKVFPPTLSYCVWALTMVPCALVALYIIHWKVEHDWKSILLGCTVGFTGAGGQLLLFQALRQGPAYIIFPFISLYPILTIFLSVLILRERTNLRKWIGIGIALIAILLLSYQDPSQNTIKSNLWLILSLLVFVAWGLQAYVMKFSNETMKAESIFFYMTITGLLLMPVAYLMTDFSQPIEWGFKGPYLAALIQVLNAIGALTLVYALRYGKAIIVVPMTGLAPLITIVLSLALYSVIPGMVLSIGLVMAVIAMFILSFD
ncbi:MAG TPA: EamA family transporter [Bacteroidales bacterium]|nr:EamA family transporter [Bacteroidales bacterium]HPT03898.1 EamA family transporter [Bacteroidales bacterium]